MKVRAAAAAACVPVALAAGAAARGAPRADIAAKDFAHQRFDRSARVDNPWFPLKPGTFMEFWGRTTDGERRVPRRIVFVVTDLTKLVAGVHTAVIWERDYSDGELVEAEIAFFGQDDAGNVWQLGEYPEEYENGTFTEAKPWLAGTAGARAGIAMKAAPRLGSPSYAEGFAPPPISWNDRAKIDQVDARICLPYNCFDHVLVTAEYNPGEPGQQLKYYARGIGNVLVGWRGNDPDKETLALVDRSMLGPAGLAKARAAARRLERHAYRVSKTVYGTTQPLTRLNR